MNSIDCPASTSVRRRFIARCTALFTTLALLPTLVAAQHVQRYDNGHWFDGQRFVAKTVFVVDGTFRDTVDAEPGHAIDLAGAFIVPPFGDAHDHGLASPHFDRENAQFLRSGIYYVSNPNSVLRWTKEARPHAAKPTTVDARYANGGLTSSAGHPVQIYDGLARQIEGLDAEDLDGEAYFTIDDLNGLDARWPEILAGQPDFLKIYLETAERHAQRRDDPAFYGKRGLDPSLVAPIVTRAHQAGLKVSAHVTTAFDFRTALEAGVDEIAHLPLEPLTDALAKQAAANQVVVVTTALSHRPTPGVDDLDALHRDNIRMLKQHGVRMVLGTDSDKSVVDEAMHLRELGVFSAAELLQMLSVDTPRWIFPGRRVGRLAEGYEASFLVLDGNPLEDLTALRKISMRIKNGRPIELADDTSLPSIAQTLVGTIMHEGVDAGIAEYHRLKREKPDAYDFSEPHLNALGYTLIQHQKVAGAIVVFKLNVEMFPKSANVYDSLAEAYMTNGDRDLAIENYRRSLELNPHNENATAKLKELEAGSGD